MSSPSSAESANNLTGIRSALEGTLPVPALAFLDPRTEEKDAVSARAKPMSVCMVPYCLDNPYQRELSEKLRHCGTSVTARENLKGLLSDLRAGRMRLDVVHLHWLRMFTFHPMVILRFVSFLLRLLMLRSAGCGIVWTVHNLYGHESRHPKIERLIARLVATCASRVIVHSPTAAELVAQEFGVRRSDKIVVVPHGNYINCYPNEVSRREARERLGLPQEDTVLLFLGKIRPYKGVRELVTTFQSLPSGRAHLVVAGSPLNQAVADEIRAEIKSASVHLHPRFVPDEDIQLYMNAADAVVLPYQDVLTSGAVVLAMSFGKACIAARIGCIPDMLDDDGALLYDPVDPNGLRDALNRALAQPERLRDMGWRNFERAQEWGWERVARETAAVYRQSTVI